MIIFLNGASSSGKSSIAKALQHLSSSRFLSIGIDSFIKMMPIGMLGFSDLAKDGFFLVQNGTDINPEIQVRPGSFGKKICQTAALVSQLIADQGFDLIIDEVISGPTFMQMYVLSLRNHKTYFVKVHCDLSVLEEREILRGNRAWGMAREQFHSVHNPAYTYDLTVDNSYAAPFDSAKKILEFIKNNNSPMGFKHMEKSLLTEE